MSFPALADRRFQRRFFRFAGLYCVLLVWSPSHDGQRCSLRNAARERRGPLPSIKAADALLDERRVLTELGHETLTGGIFTVPDVSKRDKRLGSRRRIGQRQ